MKFKLLRRGLAAVLVAAFALSPLHIVDLQAAPTVFFEARDRQQITRNTFLHKITRVTEAGLLDISVLEMPLDDPYLLVQAFNSADEFGLKQPTTTILGDHNAIAGTNGDFFGLAGTHSVSLGFEMVGGEFSAQNNANTPSLLLGANGAFMQYVRPAVGFRLNGENLFHVGLINMVTDLAWPSFLTHGYIASTHSIDERLGRSYKLVVQNGVIVSVTHYSVNVPENGFVVIMNPAAFYANQHHFYVGQQAEKLFTANVNLGDLNAAISGNAFIVRDGRIAEGLEARGHGRAPRTLMGIDAAGRRLILMTIDGRTHSIGANLTEAAQYMLEFGAFHAINLDGGGSTTMAAQLPAQGGLSVINTPSEGRQRSVINTIGLVNNSSMGEITSISVNASQQNIPVGMPSPLTVLGFDDYFNYVTLQLSALSTGIQNAVLSDEGIIPGSPGPVVIQASNGSVHVDVEFNAIEVVEIIASHSNIFGQTTLNFTGVDNFGNTTRLDPTQLRFEVFPESIGMMLDNVFVPMGAGNGWARAFTDTASVFIPINLPRQSRRLIIPDAATPIEFSAWPLENPGSILLSSHRATADGYSLQMVYQFLESERTQAAYINFQDSVFTNAASFSLQLYGNNSGHWLRGNILDAEDNDFNIDFVRHIDFHGWRTLTARVPAEAVLPVALRSVYAVSLFEDERAIHQLFVDDIRVFEIYEGEPAAVPTGSRARDPLFAQVFGERATNQIDVTFVGPMTFQSQYVPEGWGVSLDMALTALTRDSAGIFYGGINNLSDWTDVPSVYFTGRYTPLLKNDLFVIQMMASAGGFVATGASQWGRLAHDLAAAPSNNIVIHTNLSPLNFRISQEFDLLHNLLRSYAEGGRNIFVVSNGGRAAFSEIRDGVRYINLPTLFDGDAPNADATILRFRLGGGYIQYSLERIFP